MKRLSPLAALVLALAAGTMAEAQTAHAPAAGANATPGTTSLSGGTVAVSRDPPSVVTTTPAKGATVAPGIMVLKVTFDQTMDPDGWRYAKGADGDYPNCLEKPRLLADGKTFVLLCSMAGGKSYSVQLNEAEQPGFTGVGHRSALPYDLTFQTSRADPVTTLPQAMKVAGLKDDEGPVESAQAADPAAAPAAKPAEPAAAPATAAKP